MTSTTRLMKSALFDYNASLQIIKKVETHLNCGNIAEKMMNSQLHLFLSTEKRY